MKNIKYHMMMAFLFLLILILSLPSRYVEAEYFEDFENEYAIKGKLFGAVSITDVDGDGDNELVLAPANYETEGSIEIDLGNRIQTLYIKFTVSIPSKGYIEISLWDYVDLSVELNREKGYVIFSSYAEDYYESAELPSICDLILIYEDGIISVSCGGLRFEYIIGPPSLYPYTIRYIKIQGVTYYSGENCWIDDLLIVDYIPTETPIVVTLSRTIAVNVTKTITSTITSTVTVTKVITSTRTYTITQRETSVVTIPTVITTTYTYYVYVSPSEEESGIFARESVAFVVMVVMIVVSIVIARSLFRR